MLDWAVDTTDLWITDEFVGERWDRSLMHTAQTRLQVSQVNPRSGDSWRPVFRWTRLSWSDSIRRRSKSDSCFLNEDRQDDLSAVRFSSSLSVKSQALMLVFSKSLYLFSWPPWERVPCSSSEYKAIFGGRVSSIRVTWPTSWRPVRTICLRHVLLYPRHARSLFSGTCSDCGMLVKWERSGKRCRIES